MRKTVTLKANEPLKAEQIRGAADASSFTTQVLAAGAPSSAPAAARSPMGPPGLTGLDPRSVLRAQALVSWALPLD